MGGTGAMSVMIKKRKKTGLGKRALPIFGLLLSFSFLLSCQGCMAFSTTSRSGSASISSSIVNKIYKKPKPVEWTIPSGNLNASLVSFVYNSLYRVQNIDNVDHAIEILSRFKYLICAEPGHLADKEILVADGIKSKVKIFGYIDMGGDVLPSLESLTSELDNIKKNGWYGVFIDQFGYDYGETRERQNTVVIYAHSIGLKCFVNAWHIEDAFGMEADAVHNPNQSESALGEGDWYLLESFLTRIDGYDEYPDNFWEKIAKAQEYQEKLKLNIACLSYKRDEASWEESAMDIENSYLLSALSGFNGWWFTDRCENDSFEYGKPFAVGNVLKEKLYQVIPGFYLAETERYLFLYDASQFPDMTVEVFNTASKKNLLNYLTNSY